MIKTIVTPHNNLLQLSIPDQYIGKEIEVIVYAKDELIEVPKGNAARFKGFLTSEEADKFEQHSNQLRSEWDRDI